MTEEASPFRMEQIVEGFRLAFDVRATRGEAHSKRAHFGRFEIHCDEGAMIGGKDSAPPPLAFFAASVAF